MHGIQYFLVLATVEKANQKAHPVIHVFFFIILSVVEILSCMFKICQTFIFKLHGSFRRVSQRFPRVAMSLLAGFQRCIKGFQKGFRRVSKRFPLD